MTKRTEEEEEGRRRGGEGKGEEVRKVGDKSNGKRTMRRSRGEVEDDKEDGVRGGRKTKKRKSRERRRLSFL